MCFLALATSSATGRCCSLGTVRMTPFTSGSPSSVFRSGVVGIPNSCWKAWRLSVERLKPATISSLPDCFAARVSTLAQRPRPTMPSLTGELMASFYNASLDLEIGELDRLPEAPVLLVDEPHELRAGAGDGLAALGFHELAR